MELCNIVDLALYLSASPLHPQPLLRAPTSQPAAAHLHDTFLPASVPHPGLQKLAGLMAGSSLSNSVATAAMAGRRQGHSTAFPGMR